MHLLSETWLVHFNPLRVQLPELSKFHNEVDSKLDGVLVNDFDLSDRHGFGTIVWTILWDFFNPGEIFDESRLDDHEAAMNGKVARRPRRERKRDPDEKRGFVSTQPSRTVASSETYPSSRNVARHMWCPS